MSKADAQIFDELLRMAQDTPRRCFNSFCSGNHGVAIKSHVLQRRGVLSDLADKGAIIERERGTSFADNRLVRGGVRRSNVLTFTGFCHFCDDMIFSPIEKAKPDFKNPLHLMLYAYRAHACTVQKARIWQHAYEEIIVKPGVSEEYIEQAKHKIAEYNVRELHLTAYTKLFEKELFLPIHPSERVLEFQSLELPHYFEIAASSGVSEPKLIHVNEIVNIINDDDYENILIQKYPYLLFSVIPFEGKTYLLLGRHKYVKSIFDIDLNNINFISEMYLYNFINNILMKYIETWCMSFGAYEKIKLSGKFDKIVLQMNVFRNVRYKNLPCLVNILNEMK